MNCITNWWPISFQKLKRKCPHIEKKLIFNAFCHPVYEYALFIIVFCIFCNLNLYSYCFLPGHSKSNYDRRFCEFSGISEFPRKNRRQTSAEHYDYSTNDQKCQLNMNPIENGSNRMTNYNLEPRTIIWSLRTEHGNWENNSTVIKLQKLPTMLHNCRKSGISARCRKIEKNENFEPILFYQSCSTYEKQMSTYYLILV